MHTKASNEYTLHKYMFVFMILVGKRNMEIGTKLYPPKDQGGGQRVTEAGSWQVPFLPPPPPPMKKI